MEVKKDLYRGVGNGAQGMNEVFPGRSGKIKFSLDGSETNPSKFEATIKNY